MHPQQSDSNHEVMGETNVAWSPDAECTMVLMELTQIPQRRCVGASLKKERPRPSIQHITHVDTWSPWTYPRNTSHTETHGAHGHAHITHGDTRNTQTCPV